MIEYTRRAECPLGARTPHSDYPLLAIRQLTFDPRRWPRTTARRLPAVVRCSLVLRVDIDGVVCLEWLPWDFDDYHVLASGH
ncbi:hypothetical protein AcW1_002356 [Taiwanofungus camphoratus]|nr:hypothetical protein AcW1_002356 [Antrodia cinnamomea]